MSPSVRHPLDLPPSTEARVVEGGRWRWVPSSGACTMAMCVLGWHPWTHLILHPGRGHATHVGVSAIRRLGRGAGCRAISGRVVPIQTSHGWIEGVQAVPRLLEKIPQAHHLSP